MIRYRTVLDFQAVPVDVATRAHVASGECRMRPLARMFFMTGFVFIIMFLYISVKDLKKSQRDMFSNHRLIEIEKHIDELIDKVESNDRSESVKSELKYILQWTSAKNVPFVYMGEGQRGFIERNCTHVNCFVTDNRSLLGDVTKFDIIAFAGTEVVHYTSSRLPDKRSPHQKYAFTNIESADNYPVCSDKLNNFFNWTWTYRLSSEAKWGYIVVRDSEKRIIGPKLEMHWIKLEDMDPVDDVLKEKFKTKKKAAAWFVSNCRSRSGRETFVRDLQKALEAYGLTVDVYGSCGPLDCSRDKHQECLEKIEKDYYFYLSLENSFSEDYVTEKLLHALQNNAIPIVYGGANYTRFMPDGIYLNGRQLGVKKLAEQMNILINDPDKYAEYFRWKKHYSFYRRFESIETDDYCSFCAIANNEELVKKTTVYENFRSWWDPPGRC